MTIYGNGDKNQIINLKFTQNMLIILTILIVLSTYLLEATWIKSKEDDWIQTGTFTIILGISIQSIIVMIIWLLKIPIILPNIFIANSFLMGLVLVTILLKRGKKKRKNR